MRIRLSLLAWVVFLIVPVVRAQSTGAGTQASSKVGVLNVQVAISGTAEGKQAAAELQSQFTPRSTELDNLRKQIDDLQNRLRTGQTTLSDDEKARLQREGDQLTRTFQRKQQEDSDDLNDAQQEVVNRIGRKMMDVLAKFSRENGYALILDSGSQQTPVVFSANQIDVTQDIVRLYDQSYPVKTGASSSPKPAAPATKPPASGSKPE